MRHRVRGGHRLHHRFANAFDRFVPVGHRRRARTRFEHGRLFDCRGRRRRRFYGERECATEEQRLGTHWVPARLWSRRIYGSGDPLSKFYHLCLNLERRLTKSRRSTAREQTVNETCVRQLTCKSLAMRRTAGVARIFGDELLSKD